MHKKNYTICHVRMSLAQPHLLQQCVDYWKTKSHNLCRTAISKPLII